jgi:hypothetical protein
MPFQILCLSGGGLRGLFAAEAPAGLEEASGVGLAQFFDLVAGTLYRRDHRIGARCGRAGMADTRRPPKKRGPGGRDIKARTASVSL